MSRVDELRNAFLLGATISELQGRLRVGATDATLGDTSAASGMPALDRKSFITYVEADSNVAWTTSAWRSLFEALSQLHHFFFADSTTDSTRYDPGIRVPPYLFPDEPSYADIGIAPDPLDHPVLHNFKLRDVTRRGLNCLTLLIINPDVSLLPDEVRHEQRRLVKAYHTGAPTLAPVAPVAPVAPGGDGGGAPPQPTDAGAPAPAAATVNLDVDDDDADVSAEDRDAAISAVTRILLMYLHAWEGYLRESFLAIGMTRDAQNNLIAFEAGLSLAWLSWGITVNKPADQIAARTLWSKTFSDGSVSRLQHQIGVFCSAIDEASGSSPQPAGATAVMASSAVRRSLDYWQRAVTWLSTRPAMEDPDPSHKNRDVLELSMDDWDRLRLALIEQTGIWRALVLQQQYVREFSAESVTQKLLQDVAAKFQQLAARRGLFDAATAVGQEVVAEAHIATDRVQQVAQNALKAVFTSFWPVFAVLGVIAVIGIAVLVQHVAVGQNTSLLTDLVTPITAGVGALALLVNQWRGVQRPATRTTVATTTTTTSPTPPAAGDAPATTAVTPVAPATVGWANVADRIQGVVGAVGGALLADFARGFEQAKQDLDWLGHSVGVTYPLVEYFILNANWTDMRADIDFMQYVAWNETDQRDEIVRLASAAFGPIGAFALSAQTPPAD